PFDLTVLAVRLGGKDAGTATPHHITRHAHPHAPPQPPPRDDPPPPPKPHPEPLPADDAPRATGIDYLALLGEQHDKRTARPVNYAALAPAGPASHQDQDQDEQTAETGASGEAGDPHPASHRPSPHGRRGP